MTGFSRYELTIGEDYRPCRGGHMWYWTASATENAEPYPEHRCECGAYAWKDRHKLMSFPGQEEPLREKTSGTK